MTMSPGLPNAFDVFNPYRPIGQCAYCGGGLIAGHDCWQRRQAKLAEELLARKERGWNRPNGVPF